MAAGILLSADITRFVTLCADEMPRVFFLITADKNRSAATK
jgi:hypothetical protein